MTKVKQSMMVKQIQQDVGVEVYSSDDQQAEQQQQQVSMMPSTFFDFLRFQYNTSNSFSNFLCKFAFKFGAVGE